MNVCLHFQVPLESDNIKAQPMKGEGSARAFMKMWVQWMCWRSPRLHSHG